MIHVTEKARHELRELLHAKVDWPGARLRLIDRGKGVLGLGIDLASPEDEVIECDGETILVYGPEFTNGYQLITLDVDDSLDGHELVIIEKKLKRPASPAFPDR
jgi:hypothetical protein